MADPALVRQEEGGPWGVYFPDRNVIEAAIGDEVEEIPGEFLGVHWHRAEEADLRAELEADIERLRADIDEMQERDLSDAQASELNRLELRLESYERVLQIAEEVNPCPSSS